MVRLTYVAYVMERMSRVPPAGTVEAPPMEGEAWPRGTE
jgi:hypothetical protein